MDLTEKRRQQLNERVTRGVELLDDMKPGWEKRINLTDLDISDGCRCVLGQLYGDYHSGTDEMHTAIDDGVIEEFDGEDFGFEVPQDLTDDWDAIDSEAEVDEYVDVDDVYRELKVQWEEVVRERVGR